MGINLKCHFMKKYLNHPAMYKISIAVSIMYRRPDLKLEMYKV